MRLRGNKRSYNWYKHESLEIGLRFAAILFYRSNQWIFIRLESIKYNSSLSFFLCFFFHSPLSSPALPFVCHSLIYSDSRYSFQLKQMRWTNCESIIQNLSKWKVATKAHFLNKMCELPKSTAVATPTLFGRKKKHTLTHRNAATTAAAAASTAKH